MNKPILYVVDASVAITGAFIAVRNEARAMKELLHIVLVLPKGSRIPAEALQDFWRVEYVEMLNPSKNMSALIRYVPALLCAAWTLKKQMKKDRCTRLQLNDFFLMQGLVLRLMGFKGYIAAWIRCDPARFAGAMAKPMLWLLKRSSNQMVAVSSFIYSLLPKNYSVEVLYDYYSGSVRKPKTWQEDEEKTIICVGNYIRGKGQDNVLTAFSSAAARDSSLRLSFYGGDMSLPKNRDYRKQLEYDAQESGFSSRITFGNFLADTFPVLESAFAAINLSQSESFSMTVLEASGAGLPVITAASGGPQEIIKHGITGFVVPVNDAASAAECILVLSENTALAAKMGEAGALHVQQQFSKEIFCRKLCSILQMDEKQI